MLEKARELPADELVIDLEDAVIPADKDGARAALVEQLAKGEWRAPSLSVRVNPPGSPWFHNDVIALARSSTPPATIVLPKVESSIDVMLVDRLLDGIEAGSPRRIGVQALIETAAGLVRLEEIAAAPSERLTALIVGYADLALSLGRSGGGADPRQAWEPARHAVLACARTNGLEAIDGPHLGVDADAEMIDAATLARELGFDGKWVIHPAQIEAVNEIFSPSSDEVARARKIVAAAERAAREGVGAIALDGQMVDRPVELGARRVLARAALTERCL
jgi:citrate lyase subunit beta / citryl-CoA lyase